MLPSYNYALPTGRETGHFLSLDVGGSGVRIALVGLLGKTSEDDEARIEIVKVESSDIDESVRKLKGEEFFDWLAGEIERMVADDEVKKYLADAEENSGDGEMGMGVAWSFPIE
jgi:hexokinase